MATPVLTKLPISIVKENKNKTKPMTSEIKNAFSVTVKIKPGPISSYRLFQKSRMDMS